VTYQVTDFTKVADTLSVVPFVYADGSIGLQTDIRIGSKSKPEGVVQTSIITERSINVGENRIEPGKSLVIGGMRKAEIRSVVRGVPFFKDLPLVGVLFSSKDYEENATEIVFILTPSVSPGSVPYQEMADMIRGKFETPTHTSDLDTIMTDPLGSDAYSEVVSKEADQAETEIVRLQVEAAEARRQAQAEQLRAQKALLEADAMRARSLEMQALLDKATAAQKASLAEQQALEKETRARQAEISQTQEAIRKAQSEAEAARAEAQKARAALKDAEEKVQSFNQQEQQAQQKAREIQQRIDELQKQSTTEETPEAQSQPESPEQE
jgi:flagellar biosynthesis GTPase FlhF